ncbi:uncharacterized protein LOC107001356 [Solanum pennellii]|uniref:Uncharacterized protein LOC107001356 n=1 Tax=Solanum pennellii TaxID=28526 RepID=A0ABM1FCI5_SOLPN|nr:uncharacterized protein LOC107001356 [Solanum pennellii]
MKTLAEKPRTEVSFEIGDWVYVKLKSFKQVTLNLQKNHKLGRRYFGPFKVLKRIGSVAYKLTLPEATKSHPIFHVSMLKSCVGTPEQQVTPLQLIDFADPTSQLNTNLEDKFSLQGGSIVVNSNTLVDDKDDTENEIMEQHMDMPRRSARKVIPPA